MAQAPSKEWRVSLTDQEGYGIIANIKKFRAGRVPMFGVNKEEACAEVRSVERGKLCDLLVSGDDDAELAKVDEVAVHFPEHTVRSVGVLVVLGDEARGVTFSDTFYTRQRGTLREFICMPLSEVERAMAVTHFQRVSVLVDPLVAAAEIQKFIDAPKPFDKKVELHFVKWPVLRWATQRCVVGVVKCNALRADSPQWFDVLGSFRPIATPSPRTNAAFEFRELFLMLDRAGWWEGDGDFAVAKRVFDFFV